MKKIALTLVLMIACVGAMAAANNQSWRTATDAELAKVIPARAPVEKEHIETELRTAAGIINKDGKAIAGVVMITAGYSADGKYSHYFLTQVPIEIKGVQFKPGNYVFGSKRLESGEMEVRFYEAATAKEVVAVNATLETSKGPIRSLVISPPENGRGTIKIGRFSFAYSL
jgi:hypothetical protein